MSCKRGVWFRVCDLGFRVCEGLGYNDRNEEETELRNPSRTETLQSSSLGEVKLRPKRCMVEHECASACSLGCATPLYAAALRVRLLQVSIGGIGEDDLAASLGLGI